jgi:hypothetical protein
LRSFSEDLQIQDLARIAADRQIKPSDGHSGRLSAAEQAAESRPFLIPQGCESFFPSCFDPPVPLAVTQVMTRTKTARWHAFRIRAGRPAGSIG